MATRLGTAVCASHNATGVRHAFLALPIVPKISDVLHASYDLAFSESDLHQSGQISASWVGQMGRVKWARRGRHLQNIVDLT